MFGLGKVESQCKETERLLHELFGMPPNDAADIVRDLAKILFPAVEPLNASLLIAVMQIKLLVGDKQLREAHNLKAKLLEVTPILVATKQLSQEQVDAALDEVPSFNESDQQVREREELFPSRVESVRAGAIFTFYWQVYRAKNSELPKPSPAELASLEAPLRSIFKNSNFTLDKVVAVYQQGNGSNEVLQIGMKGNPDYVFRWFRIGQVVSGLLESAQKATELDFEFDKVAVRGNLSTGGVSESDCDQVIAQAENIRKLQVSPDNYKEVLRLVGHYQELYINAAAKQDSFAEFERRAAKHGGVFISYSRRDGSQAREVALRLEAAGVGFWLDEREIVAGEDVRRTLADALQANCVFVILLSKDSIRSPWVRIELEMACQGATRGTHAIIPVLLSGVSASEMPDIIGDVVAVDFSSGVEESFPVLHRSITSHLVKFEERRRSSKQG